MSHTEGAPPLLSPRVGHTRAEPCFACPHCVQTPGLPRSARKSRPRPFSDGQAGDTSEPDAGGRMARRHSVGAAQRDPIVPSPAPGPPWPPPPALVHSSGTVTWPQGPALTPVVPAQLPGPHPAPPVRPQVLSASCLESPSPGLPLSLPGPALSCHHSPLHALPNRRPSRCPRASRLVLGGGGTAHLPLQKAGGVRGPASSRAPPPLPQPCGTPTSLCSPFQPGWRSGLSCPFGKTGQNSPWSFCSAGLRRVFS